MDSAERYALHLSRSREGVVGALARRLERVGLDGVLRDLDRTATARPVPGEAAGDGFAWDQRDQDDRTWWPQGVATVRGGSVLLVAWYAKRRRLLLTHGSRVSVVDRSDPRAPRYRHVLLVGPRRRAGLLGLRRVPVHAGGIAVLGDLLYVADTLAGLRVFRLSDVVRVPRRRLDALLPWPGAGTRTLGHRPTGGFTAYGYRYVLPEVLQVRVPWHAVGSALRGSAMRWSFLSVGEVDGALSLVVGEYGRKGSTPRLARYPLDPATGLPAFDADGRCRPLEVHEDQPPRMQGAAVHGSTWYLSASAGPGRPGDLHVGTPGAFRRHRGVLPPSPEDLDWSRPGQELWSATEGPGHRFAYPVDVTRWAGPAGPG